MATKKRAQLVAGLLEGRRAAASATLHVLPVEPREQVADVELMPLATPLSEPLPPRGVVKGAKRCGDLSAVPIAAQQAIPMAPETTFHQKSSATAASFFHQKGSATAASFRPWYWQY